MVFYQSNRKATKVPDKDDFRPFKGPRMLDQGTTYPFRRRWSLYTEKEICRKNTVKAQGNIVDWAIRVATVE